MTAETKMLEVVAATVCGGLALFLLGMKHLSNGLQAVNGAGLRKFMSFATAHRMAGVATGVISTIIVQSSSVIAVMLVGFVTSRLMTLEQSLNVLIGANIGTTFTVWLMAFAPSPETMGLVTFVIGMFLYFPMRRGAVRNCGLALIGLGLVFLGMYFMKEGVAPIKTSPQLSEALKSLAANDLAHVALVALASALVTAIIQSSAASILIFMTFAMEGLLSYETAIAALFGANVGTTMTGWLAAIGAGSAARRTALAHTLTNLVGSLILMPFILPVIVPAGRAIFPSFFEQSADGLYRGIMLPIACTDTVFAILRGVMVYPFVKPLTALLMRLVPEPPDEKPHLSALNSRIKASGVIACEQAMQEIAFMAESIKDLMHHVRLVLSGEGDEKVESHIMKREEILDNVQKEVTEFIGSMMSGRLGFRTAIRARRILRLADELESASDEAPHILKALERYRDEAPTLDGSELALILDIHDRADAMVSFSRDELENFTRMDELRKMSKELKERILSARQVQMLRIGTDSKASTAAVLAILDILNAYERLRGYSTNIAEAAQPIF